MRLLAGLGGYAAASVVQSAEAIPSRVASAAGAVSSLLVVATVAVALADGSARGLSLRAAGLDIADARSPSAA